MMNCDGYCGSCKELGKCEKAKEQTKNWLLEVYIQQLKREQILDEMENE